MIEAGESAPIIIPQDSLDMKVHQWKKINNFPTLTRNRIAQLF